MKTFETRPGADPSHPPTQGASPPPDVCPRCRKELFQGSEGGASLLGCGRGGGVWLDSLASGAIMQGASRELVDLAELASRHARVAPDFSAPPVCPTCQRGLVRVEVPGTATEIYTCSVHGTWFDSNVLPMVALAFERPPANIVTAAAAVGQAIVTEDHAAATRMSRFIAAGIDGSLEVMVGLALLVLVKLLAGVLPVSLTLLALPMLGVFLFQCFQWVLLAQDGTSSLVCKPPTATVKLKFLDEELASRACSLAELPERTDLATDGDGILTLELPVTLDTATLTFAELDTTCSLSIGCLDPIETMPGVQQRRPTDRRHQRPTNLKTSPGDRPTVIRLKAKAPPPSTSGHDPVAILTGQLSRIAGENPQRLLEGTIGHIVRVVQIALRETRTPAPSGSTKLRAAQTLGGVSRQNSGWADDAVAGGQDNLHSRFVDGGEPFGVRPARSNQLGHFLTGLGHRMSSAALLTDDVMAADIGHGMVLSGAFGGIDELNTWLQNNLSTQPGDPESGAPAPANHSGPLLNDLDFKTKP